MARELTGARCGPDVTAPVTGTISNIKTTFRSWTWGPKFSACTALYGPKAQGAWGMGQIALCGYRKWQFRRPAMQGGPEPCTWTVSYKGTCYQASDVNYLMWGAINKACWRSPEIRIMLGPMAKPAVFTRNGAGCRHRVESSPRGPLAPCLWCRCLHRRRVARPRSDFRRPMAHSRELMPC